MGPAQPHAVFTLHAPYQDWWFLNIFLPVVGLFLYTDSLICKPATLKEVGRILESCTIPLCGSYLCRALGLPGTQMEITEEEKSLGVRRTGLSSTGPLSYCVISGKVLPSLGFRSIFVE